jgi:cellular nucleic acid-binding protein
MGRYKEHLAGNGSVWTRQHRPVEVVKIIEGCSNFDEDKYTKEYMAKYGIDNVRGGTYVETKLSSTQKDTIHREIWGAQDKCTRCGREGHFVDNCYAKTVIDGGGRVTGVCYRCGNKGHYAQNCYATTHVEYSEYSDSDSDDGSYYDDSADSCYESDECY